MKLSIVPLFAALAVPAVAFSPQQPTPNKVPAHVAVERSMRQAGAAMLAASTILSNVIVPLPSASAAEDNAFFSSTQVVAARSGGRAGGRSSAPRRTAPAPAPRVIERRTTVIQQAPPVYASPGYGYAQPAAPSGLGLAIGLNAVSGIASGMREARQENEIRSTRDQLTEARIKEAEMEARLRGLEQQQMVQQMQNARPVIAPQ